MSIFVNGMDGGARLDPDKGQKRINKYGRATDCDNGDNTDIHDRANATDNQKIWLAPTAARVHNIASTNVGDASGGTGARTLKIFGLTAWDAEEVSETITLNGTTNVATTNSYVIIHRMFVVTFGSDGPNLGQISATAVTDATITATILAGEGQTQMAIYGVPSTQCLHIRSYYASAIKASSSLAVAITLLVATDPENNPTKYLVKHTIGIATEGSNYLQHDFCPFYTVNGPAIVKIQSNASSNNTDVSAGFDFILEDI